VDLFGFPADYACLEPLAKRLGLFLLEDAAQSLGAVLLGRRAGAFGDAAATSFFPSKPLGGYGDGGAVFTSDPELAETARSLRTHGRGPGNEFTRLGMNVRLDTLQAAILLCKLEVFPRELEMRRRVAARYTEGLQGVVETPQLPDGVEPAWAQYSVRSSRREELMDALKRDGIPYAVYYPKPLHLQPVFAPLGYAAGDFPVAEKTAAEIFSLPMGPYLLEADQDRIIARLKAAS
jgi:dTDP-4-amino-4,6-dideoxygalactose transaminase